MLHVTARRTYDALHATEKGRLSFSRRANAAETTGLALDLSGQVFLEYALIGDTLLTWTISDGTLHLMRRPLKRDDFVRTVERAGAALEANADPDAIPPELERLYDWLIRPAQARDFLGAAGTPLVIVADGEIARVPFAVLRDRSRGRYLTEDRTIRFAASLADAARPADTSPPGPALLVGNPKFDRHSHAWLDPLDGAAAEVEALRRIYPGANVLSDSDATRSAFAEAAPRAGIIHYAGHAVFDDTRPERSYLLFAGEDTSGHLTAEAVDSLDLRGVRLVVLSACRTLRARDGRAGGFAGLSGALLGAGAGGVVGSVWNVSDSLSKPLMLAFHREYARRPGNPAEALRQAQLSMLRHRDPALHSPSVWGGIRYVGR